MAGSTRTLPKVGKRSNRFYRWQKAAVWNKLLEHLQAIASSLRARNAYSATEPYYIYMNACLPRCRPFLRMLS
ncbi:hypothetical protein [Nostoc sp.]|uniref:hypothetical protein n=1 Tax=Nostoc sp. TaxID=1180 RepID=UPI002FFC8EA9